MLTRLEQAQAQWGGASQDIDNWLIDRKELLISYCQLAGLPPYDKEMNSKGLPSSEALQNFCQLLVDYVSTGHFEIYEQLTQDCDDEAQAAEYISGIADNTDMALDFNDHYAVTSPTDTLADFDQHLSQLGQSMEHRFEIEDKLLAQLYQKVVS
jgi:regulator of sigma D